MTLSDTIGPTLKRARERAKLSQGQLVKAMGQEDNMRTWLSRIENSRGAPTLDTIASIAQVLNVPAWELVKRAEEMTESK